MINEELLKIIVCPETKQELVLAEPEIIEEINGHIEKGNLKNRSGESMNEKLDGGLIQKEDRKYLYPIRHGIPVLLTDESILIDSIS